MIVGCKNWYSIITSNNGGHYVEKHWRVCSSNMVFCFLNSQSEPTMWITFVQAILWIFNLSYFRTSYCLKCKHLARYETFQLGPIHSLFVAKKPFIVSMQRHIIWFIIVSGWERFLTRFSYYYLDDRVGKTSSNGCDVSTGTDVSTGREWKFVVWSMFKEITWDVWTLIRW